MGVDCKVYLPMDVRVKDVCTVMGVALGGKIEKINLPSGSFYVKVYNYTFNTMSWEPSMCSITVEIEDEAIKEYTKENLVCPYYFFEGNGYREMIFGSRWISIELAKTLVRFFGGYADFNNCDDIVADIFIPQKDTKYLRHDSNEEYNKFQNDLADVKIITIPENKA